MEKQLTQEIVQWDIRNWSKALNYWEENIEWNNVERCLEIGGREGGLSLWLALKNKQVVCSDVIDVTQVAGGLHARYGVEKQVSYEIIDATNIPYENHFDVIVFKSILAVIGRDDNLSVQRKVVEQVYKALKPGGKMIFAENLLGSPMHQLLRRKFVKWGKRCRYPSINEVESLMQKFRTYTFKSTGFVGLLGRSESQRDMLARLDQVVFNYCFPASWKYIIYGIAEK